VTELDELTARRAEERRAEREKVGSA
jgi:hypothetical protein